MSTEGLSPKVVVEVLREKGTITEAARALGINRNTFHSFLHRNEIDTSDGASNARWDGVDTGEQSVSGDGKLDNIEGLIRGRGLDPHEFEAYNIRLNEYGKCGECGHGGLEQNRVDLRPRRDLLLPARTEGWRPPKDAKSRRVSNGLIAFFGDQHCPSHDVELHRLAVAWLREHRPEKLCLLGDLLDYEAVSRHRKISSGPSLQETVDAAWGVLRDYREASPGTEILLLEGNHEDRLRNALSDKGLLPVSSLSQASSAGVPVLSTAHLLRLDELEITQVFPPEGSSYEHAELKVTPSLAARHGHIASAGSGVSALKTLDKLRRNVVVGHTHRQSIVFHTHWDINDCAHRLVAVEAGCMADITNGMNYASAGAPDWQQGFAVAQVFGDDKFTVDLASFVNGKLFWRDREYQ